MKEPWQRSDGASTYLLSEARDARDLAEEREREWLRRLEYCQCARPLYDRAYLGRVGCSLCGKLTHREARVARPVQEPMAEAA